MAMRNPKKNPRKESWERTSGTTKWDKLGQVGLRGDKWDKEKGFFRSWWDKWDKDKGVFRSSWDKDKGVFRSSWDKWDKDKGSVHLNHSTCPKWDYKAVHSSGG